MILTTGCQNWTTIQLWSMDDDLSRFDRTLEGNMNSVTPLVFCRAPTLSFWPTKTLQFEPGVLTQWNASRSKRAGPGASLRLSSLPIKAPWRVAILRETLCLWQIWRMLSKKGIYPAEVCANTHNSQLWRSYWMQSSQEIFQKIFRKNAFFVWQISTIVSYYF